MKAGELIVALGKVDPDIEVCDGRGRTIRDTSVVTVDDTKELVVYLETHD